MTFVLWEYRCQFYMLGFIVAQKLNLFLSLGFLSLGLLIRVFRMSKRTPSVTNLGTFKSGLICKTVSSRVQSLASRTWQFNKVNISTTLFVARKTSRTRQNSRPSEAFQFVP